MRKIVICWIAIVLCPQLLGAQQITPEEKKLASSLAALPTDEARREALQREHTPVTPGLIRGVITEGIRFFREGDYPSALGLYVLSFDLAEASGDKRMQFTCLYFLAIVRRQMGDYEQALDLGTRSLVLARESGANAIGIADCLEVIGSIEQYLGDYPTGIQNIRDALATVETAGDRMRTAMFRDALALMYRNMGDYGLALESYEKSLDLGPSPEGKAMLLNNIGVVHEAQGNLELALDFYQKSLQLTEEIGYKGHVASTLMNLGSLYQRMGRNQLASDYLLRALRLGEAEGDREIIAQTHLALGKLQRAQGKFDEALQHLQNSASLYHTMHYRANEALALSGLAETETATREYAQAAVHATQALELAREVSDPAALWNASNAAAHANLQLGKRAEARAEFLEAIDTIESLRGQVAGGEQDRERFFEDKLSPYHELTKISIEDRDSTLALAYAERAKARVLLETLRNGRVLISKSMTAEERSREGSLLSRLGALESRLKEEDLHQESNRGRAAQLQKRVEAMRLELAVFRSGLYANHPELRVNRLQEPPATLEEIAALLPDKRSAALEYVVMENETYLFVVTTDAPQLHVYRIRVTRGDLGRQTLHLRDLIAARDLGYRGSAEEMRRLLLEPARNLLRRKTMLLLVPDGVLWQLPFQALVAGGRYLIEDYTISYSPSLTVLREVLKRRRPQAEPSVLAMGNPEQNLPGADAEINALREIYGAARTRVYTGAQAREATFKAEANKYSILHLLTHAELDDQQPMYSRLVLAEVGKGEPEDGLLEAREMIDLDLKADLVVLSACETAAGRVGAGEGLIGMTWALFVAGAPAIVASAWKVDSASTARLMIQFHRGLKSGLGNASALRQAELALLNEPEYRHPFYWAGFSVLGEGF